jgi:superfamily II DNA or RNA helicase
MLMDVRHQHPDAAGLLVAYNQENAQALAATLQELTGRTPVVALSDDAKASKRIQAFTHSTDEWIVACNMVSEGVDIPRLRVGVYATTVTTKLYFRQFLGRITRQTPWPTGVQVGYCYLPADLRITHLAQEVEQEQRHYVSGLGQVEKEYPAGEFEMLKVELKPVSGSNQLDGVIVNGRQLSLFGGAGEALSAGQLKSVVEAEVNGRFLAPELVETLSENKAELKREIRRLAGLYHHNADVGFAEIYGRLNRMQQVSGQEKCTVDQLQERIQTLSKWLG